MESKNLCNLLAEHRRVEVKDEVSNVLSNFFKQATCKSGPLVECEGTADRLCGPFQEMHKNLLVFKLNFLISCQAKLLYKISKCP